MKKTDVSNYEELDALTFEVFNTQGLYDLRHDDDFLDVINNHFIFTKKQYLRLINDLDQDLKLGGN